MNRLSQSFGIKTAISFYGLSQFLWVWNRGTMELGCSDLGYCKMSVRLAVTWRIPQGWGSSVWELIHKAIKLVLREASVSPWRRLKHLHHRTKLDSSRVKNPREREGERERTRQMLSFLWHSFILFLRSKSLTLEKETPHLEGQRGKSQGMVRHVSEAANGGF